MQHYTRSVPFPPRLAIANNSIIILPVVFCLVWALNRDVKVLGLLRCERGQLDVQLFKVCTGNLLVEFLWQYVHANSKLARVRPQGNLSQDLVGERARHHK